MITGIVAKFGKGLDGVRKYLKAYRSQPKLLTRGVIGKPVKPVINSKYLKK